MFEFLGQGSKGNLAPIRSAVALATRNTMAGLSFLPPAPKICSAAASKRGCRLPTMFLRFSAICSISSLTGPRMSLEEIDWELRTQSPLTGKLLSSAEAGLSAVETPPEAFVEVCEAKESRKLLFFRYGRNQCIFSAARTRVLTSFCSWTTLHIKDCLGPPTL